MDEGNFSVSRILRLLGCLVLDIAVLVAFFKVFAFFSILAPAKSVLMLMVLLIGLIVSNGAIVFPDILFRKIGIAFPTSIIILSVMYTIVSNILSVFLIAGSIIWYIVWELSIFAVFIGVFSIIASFSKRAWDDIKRVELEQDEKNSINVQLMEIEAAIIAKQNDDGILPIFNSFKELKRRMNASTPFGRMAGNSKAIDIENVIKSNLVSVQSKIQSNLTDEGLADVQRLLDDTRRLVVNREAINIR
ncbi:MAG: hypothetical protein AB7G87_03020 [Clostridia bacterium]